jgi:hypothetical protein
MRVRYNIMIQKITPGAKEPPRVLDWSDDYDDAQINLSDHAAELGRGWYLWIEPDAQEEDR